MMGKPLELREMTEEEQDTIQTWMKARNVPRWQGERARMIWYASQGKTASWIGRELHLDHETVSRWLHRFQENGLAGLADDHRSGRPATYSQEEVSIIISCALTDPQTLHLPFASWTLDRLTAYLNEEKQIGIQRSRLDELLLHEGLRWRKQERWFGQRVDPDFAQKRGPSSSSTRVRRPRALSCVSTS